MILSRGLIIDKALDLELSPSEENKSRFKMGQATLWANEQPNAVHPADPVS